MSGTSCAYIQRMKIEIPEQKKLVYEMTLPIRWGDMDAMQHVNNAAYFRYMETARIDWLRSIGGMAEKAETGPVIVNAFCNFYKQLEYPGDVLIKTYASDPKRTTVETWVTMERSDKPGLVHAAGGATLIWVNYAQQKAVDLPDWVRVLVTD